MQKFQLKKGAGITKIHQLTQNTFVRNNNKTNKFFFGVHGLKVLWKLDVEMKFSRL